MQFNQWETKFFNDYLIIPFNSFHFILGGHPPANFPQPSQPPPVQNNPMNFMMDSGPADDEPPNKKQRSEDNLIPEAEFMATHKGPVSLQVQAPSGVDKAEWRLNGQIISITLSLNDSISTLKSKIQEETSLPPAKQKISYEGMFFKDNNTIAFYNLLSGTTVQLQIKERGGRKK